MSISPSVAIVLAGGAGTRLREALPGIPKVLAPIHGRPFLHLLFDRLVQQGIESVVLASGDAADRVESVAGEWEGPLEMVFSRETEPLGTGGAIAQSFECVATDRAWVLNGDSFCEVDFAAVSAKTAASPRDAWMVAVEVPDAGRFGTVELSGSLVVRYLEKSGLARPGWINAGIYLLPRELMSSGACSIEQDWFPRWTAQARLRAVPVHGRFIDIGTPASLAMAESFFA